MGAVADRFIRGEGTPEQVWQPWIAGQHLPVLPVESLLWPGGRLVVVAPHPDDEVLACGALLAMQVQRRGPVLVLAVTDGEASHGVQAEEGANRLGERRRLESLLGLQSLGVPPEATRRLGLPDGQVTAYREVLSSMLKDLLHPLDLVVTTWRLDGHPDHEATGAAVADACAARACRLIEAPVWMWHWSEPGDPRVPWQRLYALPVSAAAQQLKARALAAHASQLQPRGGLGPVLGNAILGRAARNAEYFFI